MRQIHHFQQHHEDFAKLYCQSWDSLDSYLKSHKNILKVKASDLLCNDQTWLKIIHFAYEYQTPYGQTVIQHYEKCINNAKMCPFLIFRKYIGGYKKHRNPDAINVVYLLCNAFDFFDILKREYYTVKIRSAILLEMEYINKLDHFKKPFDKMKLDLQKNGINFNYILNPEE